MPFRCAHRFGTNQFVSCPTSRCLSTPEPALNAPGLARSSRCRWASIRILHAERVGHAVDYGPRRSRRAAGGRCPRPPRCPRPRLQFSHLLLLRLDISDVGPVERVAVRARTTPPTSVDLPPPSRSVAEKAAASACRRPGIPNAPGSTPRRQLLVCSRCCSQPSRTPCTGGRAPVSGAFAAAALLGTAFMAWELRWSHPMLDPRFVRIPAFRQGSAIVTISFFVATRDDGPAQVRVRAACSQAVLAALGAACRLRAGTKSLDRFAAVRADHGGCGVGGVGECGS
jgi:hypothetical protein